MREAFILLFLIVSYNYILYYITVNNLSSIPLFPTDTVNTIIVLSFNLALYIGWFFGERRRLVTTLGYLFFFQIVLLSILLKNPHIFIANTIPVIFTFMLVVLFESPFEKEKKRIEEEKKKLLDELEENKRKRVEIEEKINEFKRNISLLKIQLEQKEKSLKEAKRLKEDVKKIKEKEKEIAIFKEKISKLEKELEKQREKETKLLEANRKLFQLLELLGKEEEKKKGSKEVKELRKERKKLIKEVLELQNLIDIYDKENRSLRKKVRDMQKKIEELQQKIERLELEKENLQRESYKKIEVYGEFLKLLFPYIQFTEDSIRNFLKLDANRKRNILKEIEKLKGNIKLEKLATDKNIYKLKFSGGRVYLKKEKEKWVVLGILGSEEDKDKARFIEALKDKL
ncbi:MAG TPA: hypothetical protein EYH58_02000 [Aquifex aeolicus]|nr:hypothetical protein [Aquifex aeolicus]